MLYVGNENGEKEWAVDSSFDQEITSSELVRMVKYKIDVQVARAKLQSLSFDKLLSKSYDVLKIYLLIFSFSNKVYKIYKVHTGKNNKSNLIFESISYKFDV